MIIVLDAGPVGMLSNPSGDPENARCQEWLRAMPADRVLPVVPEIADYEVRRELFAPQQVRKSGSP